MFLQEWGNIGKSYCISYSAIYRDESCPKMCNKLKSFYPHLTCYARMRHSSGPQNVSLPLNHLNFSWLALQFCLLQTWADLLSCGTGAAVLFLQDNDLGIEHTVCYFSKKFLKHQLNYSTTEKEALALLLAIQHFDVYLGIVPLWYKSLLTTTH